MRVCVFFSSPLLAFISLANATQISSALLSHAQRTGTMEQVRTQGLTDRGLDWISPYSSWLIKVTSWIL